VKRIKQSATVLCVALILSLCSTIAAAYELGGYEWQEDKAYYEHTALAMDWRNAVYYAQSTWDNDSVTTGFEFWYGSDSENVWDTDSWGTQGTIATTLIFDPVIDDKYLTHVETWFNTSHSFYTNGTDDYDVQTVALHEFGHWLVLEDIPWWKFQSGAVMWYAYTGVKRSLHSDDVNGIRAIYGQ